MKVYAIFATEENISRPDTQKNYDISVSLVPGTSPDDAIKNLLYYCANDPFATIIGATETTYNFDIATLDDKLRNGTLDYNEIEIIENLVSISNLYCIN